MICRDRNRPPQRERTQAAPACPILWREGGDPMMYQTLPLDVPLSQGDIIVLTQACDLAKLKLPKSW
jgi:hypothetical protein